MTDHQKLVTDVFTSLSKGNSDVAEKQLTDDFKATVMNNQVDKKQYVRAFSSLRQGIPDLQINLQKIEDSGNKVHAWVNLTGTHSGEIPAFIPGVRQLTPSGKKINTQGLELEISLKDEKIKEIKSMKTGKEVFNEVYSQLTTN